MKLFQVLGLLPILVSSVAQAEKIPVLPGMQGYGTYEFGLLIKKLMPVNRIWWDHLANDKNIKWITPGSQEVINYDGYAESSRQGLVRINVLGSTPTILKNRKYELPWTITYKGGQERFGVTSVLLEPGDKVNGCYGYPTSNCSFEHIPSLKKQGITTKKICLDKTKGSLVYEAYQLSTPGKKTTYLYKVNSIGSGGDSTSFELYYSPNIQAFCSEIDVF
jgi:hypothetical protein